MVAAEAERDALVAALERGTVAGETPEIQAWCARTWDALARPAPAEPPREERRTEIIPRDPTGDGDLTADKDLAERGELPEPTLFERTPREPPREHFVGQNLVRHPDDCECGKCIGLPRYGPAPAPAEPPRPEREDYIAAEDQGERRTATSRWFCPAIHRPAPAEPPREEDA